MNKTATLVRNVIPAGSGIDDPDYQPRNENTGCMYREMNKIINAGMVADGTQAYLRKQAFRKGTVVTVLDIRDNQSNQHLYETQNLPGVVADIEGENWDGEIVQGCVSVDALDLGFPYDAYKRAEDILKAFRDWMG